VIDDLNLLRSELQLELVEPSEIDVARGRELELARSTDRVTIVVSARDEIENLPWLFPQLKRYGYEVLLVDGNSTDGTLEYAQKVGARVIRDHGRGKGDAVRCGIQEARGDIVVFIDADGSHDPNHIPRLLAPILEGRADQVIGSRMLGGSEELYTNLSEFIRLVGQQIITLGINYWLHVRLTDPQNGFRAARRETLLKLDLHEDLTTVEQEITIKTLRQGFRIVEVPTHEYKRRAGQSKIRVEKVWLRYVWSWLKYLFL
jgi:glycosyltransferase involved in cell wall biosynthesis